MQQAHQLVRNLHDRHPTWVHVGETSYDQAAAAIARKPPAPAGGGDVFVIEIKGKLVDDFDPRAPGTPPFKGRFYVMVLDRATCGQRILGISRKGVKLRPLGNVTTIE